MPPLLITPSDQLQLARHISEARAAVAEIPPQIPAHLAERMRRAIDAVSDTAAKCRIGSFKRGR